MRFLNLLTYFVAHVLVSAVVVWLYISQFGLPYGLLEFAKAMGAAMLATHLLVEGACELLFDFKAPKGRR